MSAAVIHLAVPQLEKLSINADTAGGKRCGALCECNQLAMSQQNNTSTPHRLTTAVVDYDASTQIRSKYELALVNGNSGDHNAVWVQKLHR
jgi:hypothetical protein